jgi:circadian clock protein KaiB
MKQSAVQKKSSKPKYKCKLVLFIAGQSPRSILALNNLKKICNEDFAGAYHLEIVDLIKHPEMAKINQIVAIPTLLRKFPKPIRRSIGDLSDREQVLAGLEIRK